MATELSVAGAIHLAAVLPALALGGAQMLRPKGTRPHRLLGWLWVLAMAVAAISSLWIMELRHGAGWSVIHLLSIWVLVSLVVAIAAIRRGNVRTHRNFMLGTLLGLAGAGAGALMPGRFLAQLFL